MLRSGLRYLDGSVAHVDRLLRHPLDLVAEDQSVTLRRVYLHAVEHNGTFDLLDGQQAVAASL